MRYATRRAAAPERRSYRLEVHLTTAEAELLRQRAATHAHGCLADYVRAAALGRQLAPPLPAINLDAYQELARVGSNLNQIASHLNAGHIQAGPRVAGLAQQLADLRDFLAEVRRLLIAPPR